MVGCVSLRGCKEGGRCGGFVRCSGPVMSIYAALSMAGLMGCYGSGGVSFFVYCLCVIAGYVGDVSRVGLQVGGSGPIVCGHIGPDCIMLYSGSRLEAREALFSGSFCSFCGDMGGSVRMAEGAIRSTFGMYGSGGYVCISYLP